MLHSRTLGKPSISLSPSCAAKLTTWKGALLTMHLLEVLNPVAKQRAMENVSHINSRLAGLDDKTIGLVWSGTHGGDVALNRVGEMLKERFANVETRFYTGGSYPNPPHILRQAVEECDAVVGATGD